MPRFILLAGLPASGKSTYRAELLTSNPQAVVVSPDDFLESRAAKMGITYQDIWRPEHSEHIAESRTRIDDILEEAISQNRDVIWDQTSLTFEMREGRLHNTPHHYDKIAVAFETDWDTLMQRNDARKPYGRDIPIEILEGMFNDYERPHFDEGFDHVILITNNGDHTLL